MAVVVAPVSKVLGAGGALEGTLAGVDTLVGLKEGLIVRFVWQVKCAVMFRYWNLVLDRNIRKRFSRGC